MTTQQHEEKYPGGKLRQALKILFALCFMGIVAAIAFYWMSNPPRAQRRGKPKDKVRIVKTTQVKPFDKRITIEAMGTVVPVDEVELAARVSGRITETNPDLVPGSHLQKGDILATVDQDDYRLALEQAEASFEEAKLSAKERKLAIEQQKSEIAKAETELTLEKARQDVAQSEYELLSSDAGAPGAAEFPSTLPDRDIESDMPDALLSPANAFSDASPTDITRREKSLMLREPQYKAAQAALNAAEARKKSAEAAYNRALQARRKAKSALEKAKLDFERTTVEIPFDAVVQSKKIGVGSHVSVGKALATLVRTDRFWINLSVPVDQLQWLDIPRQTAEDVKGAQVRIYPRSERGENRYRTGRIKSVRPDIEKDGRMARVVVDVEDPRSLKEENQDKPALFLGNFVEAQIKGRTVKNAVKVPREALRGGDRVWVLTAQNRLAIREVTIKVRTPDSVYVKEGLEPGDKLIMSDISAPVEGMKLREAGNGEKSGDGKAGQEQNSSRENNR